MSSVLYSSVGYVYLSSEMISTSPVRPEGIAAGAISISIAALNVFLFYRVNSYKFNRKKDKL